MAGQAEAGNRLEQWLRKTSTAQEADQAAKVPVATNTVKTEVAVQEANHYVLLSEVKTMTDQSLLGSKKERDSQVAEATEKTLIDAIEMCAVEAQDIPVPSTVSLAIQAVIENILDEGSSRTR